MASSVRDWSRTLLGVTSLIPNSRRSTTGIRRRSPSFRCDAGRDRGRAVRPKKALHERLDEIPIADQARRIAVNGQLRDDLLDQLEDPNLDMVHRNRLTKTAMALNRAVAEELGDLKAQA